MAKFRVAIAHNDPKTGRQRTVGEMVDADPNEAKAQIDAGQLVEEGKEAGQGGRQGQQSGSGQR